MSMAGFWPASGAGCVCCGRARRRALTGSAEQRVAQLIDGLFGLGDRCLGRLVQRGAGVGADQLVGLHLARDGFLDAGGDAEGAALFDRVGKDAEIVVQDGFGGRRGSGGGFAEQAGEE